MVVFLVAFLPPLWPLVADLVFVVLAVVAFFPGGSGCGFNELLSPPVFCARARLAPRNNVITNVNIFFIQFLRIKFLLGPLRLFNTGCGW